MAHLRLPADVTSSCRLVGSGGTVWYAVMAVENPALAGQTGSAQTHGPPGIISAVSGNQTDTRSRSERNP
jgi:hypothetical protein